MTTVPEEPGLMTILAMNAGSSSLKFEVIAVADARTHTRLASGIVGRIGSRATVRLSTGDDTVDRETPVPDHTTAADLVLDWIAEQGVVSGAGLSAIGHRVVHGGSAFDAPARIDDTVLRAIDAASDLAPLHNPPALSVIRACRQRFGDTVPMAAAFDTAFFAALPDRARRYAIPRDLAERHEIYRYGFHGLAHMFMAQRAATIMGDTELGLVTLQLGNGCSAAAVQAGSPIDTSMGLTPLEGLIMGTRSGDVDPSLVDFLASRENVSSADIVQLLNTRFRLARHLRRILRHEGPLLGRRLRTSRRGTRD